MITYTAAVGRVLAAERKNRKMTQADVASALGVAQGRISRIENGLMSLDVVALVKWARVFGMTSAAVALQAEKLLQNEETKEAV